LNLTPEILLPPEKRNGWKMSLPPKEKLVLERTYIFNKAARHLPLCPAFAVLLLFSQPAVTKVTTNGTCRSYDLHWSWPDRFYLVRPSC